MRSIGLLLSHIDRLKAVHKANLPTSPGDIEQLWDLAADVRAECLGAAIGPIAGETPLAPSIERMRLVGEVLDSAGEVVRRIPVGGTD